jgi:hypothetical protein
LALGSTQPLKEMSTSNLPEGKWRPARKADNLIAICEPTVYRKCGSLDVSQPYGPSRPVIGIALPYMYMYPIANGFRDRAISLYRSKIVDKKEILRTVSDTGIYCSSDIVGAVYIA